MTLDKARLNQLKGIGGSSLLVQMCDLFLEHTPNRVQAVAYGWQNKDYAKIEKNAHSIKSSAGNLGALEFMELCQRIESAGNQSNDKELSILLSGFEAHAQRVINEVRYVRENEE